MTTEKLTSNFLIEYKIMKTILTSLFLVLNICFSEENSNFKTLNEKVNFYKDKYKVNCVSEKITDNFGNGYDSLYGTRNMRTILFGVAYRGGANNFYHKSNKRDNHNPLPEDGLDNLCSQGFTDAIYLYSTNFNSAKKKIIKNKNTLTYRQNSGNSRAELKKIMLNVLEVINNPIKGPIYLHCWNGWHQSGYVASAILMQFCKYSNQNAFDYWIKNTDGVNNGYDNVKQLVRTFKPFEDIKISDSVSKLICPCEK